MTFIDYRSKAVPPEGPGAIVQPTPLMPMPELDTGQVKIGEAITKAGHAMAAVGSALFEAQDRTKALESLTAFQQEAAAIESGTKYASPTLGDKASVSQQLASLRQQHLGNILDPARRASVEHQMAITSIGIEKRIEQKAIGGMKDSAAVNLHLQGNQAMRDYSAAETDGQRDGIRASFQKSVRDATGMIGAKRAITILENFEKITSSADATRMLREMPVEGRRILDQGGFPGIVNPLEREQWRNHFDESEARIKYSDLQTRAITDGPDAARAKLPDFGFTPLQTIHANQIIDQVEKSQFAAMKSQAAAMASLSRSADDLTNLVKQGQEWDDKGDIAQYEATQRLAAENGNVSAMKELQKIDLYRQIGPDIRNAKKMDDPTLNAAIIAIDTDQRRRIAAGETIPNVENARLISLQAVRSLRFKARDEEPVVLGGNQGARVYSEKPIDFKNVQNDPTQFELMAERGRQAEFARITWGGSGSALLKQEAIDEKNRFEQAGPREQYQLLDSYARAFPERVAIATMAQIGGPRVGNEAFFRLLFRNPGAAQDAVSGMIIRKDKTFEDNEKEMRQELQKRVTTELYPDEREQAQSMDLVLSIAASMRGRTGQFSTSDVDTALRTVIGEISTIGGKQVPVTPGVKFMNEGAFRDAFRSFNRQDAGLLGGVFYANGTPVEPKDIGGKGTLQAQGPGSEIYALGRLDGELRFQPFFDANGGAVMINMRDYVQRHQMQPFVEPGTPASRLRHPLAGTVRELRRQPITAEPQRLTPEEEAGPPITIGQSSLDRYRAQIAADLRSQFPQESEQQIAARTEAVMENEPAYRAERQKFYPHPSQYPSFSQSAWDQAYEGWPASTNIEDRRGMSFEESLPWRKRVRRQIDEFLGKAPQQQAPSITTLETP